MPKIKKNGSSYFEINQKKLKCKSETNRTMIKQFTNNKYYSAS